MGRRRGQDEGAAVGHRDQGRLGSGGQLAPPVQQDHLDRQIRGQQAREGLEALLQQGAVVPEEEQRRAARALLGVQVFPREIDDRFHLRREIGRSLDHQGRAPQVAERRQMPGYQAAGDAARQLRALGRRGQGERGVVGMSGVARGPGCRGAARHHDAKARATEPVHALGQSLAPAVELARQPARVEQGAAVEGGPGSEGVEALRELRELAASPRDARQCLLQRVEVRLPRGSRRVPPAASAPAARAASPRRFTRSAAFRWAERSTSATTSRPARRSPDPGSPSPPPIWAWPQWRDSRTPASGPTSGCFAARARVSPAGVRQLLPHAPASLEVGDPRRRSFLEPQRLVGAGGDTQAAAQAGAGVEGQDEQRAVALVLCLGLPEQGLRDHGLEALDHCQGGVEGFLVGGELVLGEIQAPAQPAPRLATRIGVQVTRGRRRPSRCCSRGGPPGACGCGAARRRPSLWYRRLGWPR